MIFQSDIDDDQYCFDDERYQRLSKRQVNQYNRNREAIIAAINDQIGDKQHYVYDEICQRVADCLKVDCVVCELIYDEIYG